MIDALETLRIARDAELDGRHEDAKRLRKSVEQDFEHVGNIVHLDVARSQWLPIPMDVRKLRHIQGVAARRRSSRHTLSFDLAMNPLRVTSVNTANGTVTMELRAYLDGMRVKPRTPFALDVATKPKRRNWRRQKSRQRP
jgi:hypothetical protein